MVTRVVMDNMIPDYIGLVPGAGEAIQRAVKAGELELLVTHVIIDQLASIPEPSHRAWMLNMAFKFGTYTPTRGAFLLGVSRLDSGYLGSEQDSEIIDVLRHDRTPEGFLRDAVLAMTARALQVPIATNDRKLTKSCEQVGIDALSPEELFDKIGFDLVRAGGLPERSIQLETVRQMADELGGVINKLSTVERRDAIELMAGMVTGRLVRGGPLPRTGVYQHYKGQFYQLLFVAEDSTNGTAGGRRMAVYIGLELAGAGPGLQPKVRDLEEFMSMVEVDGELVPRFVYAGDEWHS